MSEISIITIKKWNPKIRNNLIKLITQYHIRLTLTKGIPFCLLPPELYHFVIPDYSDGQVIESCLNCDLKPLCPGFPANRISTKYAQPIKLIPNEVVIEITRECNRQCSFCHVSRQKGAHLPVRRIETIVQSATQLGIKAIRLTGGEPLLHPQLNTILEIIKEYNLSIIINSNGTIPEILQILVAYPVKNLLVSLNLSQDRDILTRKIAIILQAKKLVPILRIGTVIRKELIENFSAYAKIIHKLKPLLWEVYRPIPPAPDLTQQEWQTLISKMEIFNKHSKIKVKIANFTPLCWFNWKILNLSMGNFADRGHSRVVYRSHPIEGFYLDYYDSHFLGYDLTEAWFSEIAIKQRMLSEISSTCLTCRYRMICKGFLKNKTS